MTRLQKQNLPTYSSKRSSTEPLQTAVPYENLPHLTQQPVPIATAVVPSSYDAMSSTNLYSSNSNLQLHGAGSQATLPTSQLFSPVSPLESPQSQPQIYAEPQRPNARRSANLQRLDGTPYPTGGQDPKPVKPVRVAKDMHDGALPPEYRQQMSDFGAHNEIKPMQAGAHECRSCGKKLADGQDCTQCGKRKSTAPEVQGAGNHSRAVSAGIASHRSAGSSTLAGPSSSPRSSSSETHSCTKCGRRKRHESSAGNSPVHSHSPPLPRSGPVNAPIPLSDHPGMRFKQAGLSIQPNTAGHHSPTYPRIDVIPPSATTYRPQSLASAFTYGDDAPLMAKHNRQSSNPKPEKEYRPFRNNSLVRSLSRRLSSRKEKKKDNPPTPTSPLPSQQLADAQADSNEQSAGRLINMISSAMHESSNSYHHDRQYSQLSIGEDQQRPASPFSFVGVQDENTSYQMVERPEHRVEDQPEYLPGRQDTIDVISRSRSVGPTSSSNHYLSVNGPEDRPPITRFKSLRSGMNRASSTISRSQSLKRLGSVHRSFYYSDGQATENSVPVF